MNAAIQIPATAKPTHPWLRRTRIAFVPGSMTPLLEDVAEGVLRHARLQGHKVQTTPDDHIDVLLTTARLGEVVDWRESLLLSGRRRFNLSRTPVVQTLIHAPLAEFQRLLGRVGKRTTEPSRLCLSRPSPPRPPRSRRARSSWRADPGLGAPGAGPSQEHPCPSCGWRQAASRRVPL
jgi:hypothetical protein